MGRTKYKRACDVVLVAGPESSGTRVLTQALSRHAKIRGAPDALEHGDRLDAVWQLLEQGHAAAAEQAMPKPRGSILLTRRSMPHGFAPGVNARYRRYPKFDAFAEVCRARELRLAVLITVRDPIANLVSWSASRASAQGSMERAYVQYHESLGRLVRFASRRRLPYLVCPLEAFLLDGERYLNNIFGWLGLPPETLSDLKRDAHVNRKHAQAFAAHPFTAADAARAMPAGRGRRSR